MDAPPKRIKATGSHFYRYQSAAHLDWLKSIILEHEIYIPTVSQLNDPADGRPKLAALSDDQMFDFLYESTRNPTLTSTAQRKVVLTIRHSIQVHGLEKLMRIETQILNRHVENYRILSLSKRYDNLSLWAKYARDHTGYCLEFANEGPFFAHAVEVIYGDSIPMDVNNPEHRTGYFFHCKRQEWSNEEEIRLIGLPGTAPTTKIDPRWLTRIILGKNMSDDNQKQIREWAKQRRPELAIVQAYFDDLHQELRLKE